MPTDDLKQYEFPSPDEQKGYLLFPPELENDDLVLFHGTAMANFDPIRSEGFKAFPPLESVSYAYKSREAFSYVMGKRHEWTPPDAVVFAVRFESLNVPGIELNSTDIHVYKPGPQPEIIGYCLVPGTYNW